MRTQRTALTNTKRDGVTQDKFIVSVENIISIKHLKLAGYCVEKQRCKRNVLLYKKYNQKLHVQLYTLIALQIT